MAQVKEHASLPRRIFGALGVFGMVQAMTILCQIVRTKLTAIWIGTSGAGVIGLYNGTLDIILNLSSLSLRQSAVKDLSGAKTEAERNRQKAVVRTMSRTLGIAGMLLMLILSPLLSQWTFGDYSYTWGFAALALCVAFGGYVQGEQAIMQGCDALPSLAKSSAWAAVAGVAVSIPLLYFFRTRGIVGILLAYSAAGFFFSWLWRVRSSGPGVHIGVREAFVKGCPMLRLGVYMTICFTLDMLLSWVFSVYLNRWGGGSPEVGLYRSGYSLVGSYVGVIFTAIGMEYYPRLATVIGRPTATATTVRYQTALSAALCAPVMVLFIVLSPWVIRLLLSTAFEPVLPFVQIGATAIPLRASSWCLAYVILARGDGRTFAWTELASGSIYLILNLTLYNIFGFDGLGWAYVGMYVAYTLVVYGVYRLRYGMRLGVWVSVQTLALTAVGGLCLYLQATVGPWVALAVSLPLSLFGLVAVLGRKKKGLRRLLPPKARRGS